MNQSTLEGAATRSRALYKHERRKTLCCLRPIAGDTRPDFGEKVRVVFLIRVKMALTTVTCLVPLLLVVIHGCNSQAPFNPAILQDSRDLPKVDGAFGFLYRTEDGIAHAAKGEPGGIVHGRFTYTDPTGLKVNYNYNAGSRVTPKYNYDEPLSSYEQEEGRVRPSNAYREEEEYEPAPAPAPSYDSQPQQYDYVPQRKTRPPSFNRNAINTNYAY